MRILIVGASGFLGSYILKYCKEGEEQTDISAIGTSAHEADSLLHLDITKLENVQSVIVKSEPDCIINCAAMTDVDECESQPELARSINSLGPKNLAEACEKNGIKLLQISTDAVFDGKQGGYSEDSEPHPVNTYAQTKIEGEKFVASLCRNYVIVRTNFYGLDPQGRHLLNWILSNLTSGKEIVGFDDIVFNPLWIYDLAICLVKLVEIPYTGILHCAGDEIFSKYEFVKNVARYLGYTNANIKRGSSEQLSLLAQRPRETFLSNKRMKELLKIKIHTLKEVLHDTSFDIYRPKDSKKI